ncbi:hypothetical protein [Aeromonas taiwanensis]|uniref:hypothetical protein n=1 Tax=Aeromonas taiwanensis TaxID=633417 RepID=UPI003B9FD638
MKMSEHSSLCDERTSQLAYVQPGVKHEELLDLAAQEQGFDDYETLRGLLNLLGPDGVPSELEIAMAGGDSRQSPYLSVSKTVMSGWSEADQASN